MKWLFFKSEVVIRTIWPKQIGFYFSLLFSLTLLAQTYPKKHQKIKFLGNRYQCINDTLYACDTEVNQKDYKKFLYSLLPDDYEKCKIDSSLWKNKLNSSDTAIVHLMVKHYHTYTVFDIYPVVNISYYAATKYCEWLTKRHLLSSRKWNITFKLPTEQEWLLLSDTDPSTKLPYNVLNGKNGEGCYLENIKTMTEDSVTYSEDGAYYPAQTNAYWPSQYGLFNVIGNVAEMTDIEGIQKGGSWFDNLDNCLTSKVQTYTTPDPRVGFRVVAIVKRK